MSDPMQNLNDAADALNQVAARAAGFYDDADAEIAARQAAYDALAGDLNGVVNDRMYFTGVIDPVEPNPTEVDGGTFNRIDDMVNAAPRGSTVLVGLLEGVTYTLDYDVAMPGKNVKLYRVGSGARPVLNVVAFANASYNSIYNFEPDVGSTLYIQNVDINLPTAKADVNLPWSASRALIDSWSAGLGVIGLQNSIVTGGESLGLATCNGGASVVMRLRSVTLDGPIFGVVVADDGVTTLAKDVLTLQNGAALAEGGTIGTNILQN